MLVYLQLNQLSSDQNHDDDLNRVRVNTAVRRTQMENDDQLMKWFWVVSRHVHVPFQLVKLNYPKRFRAVLIESL